MTSNSSSAPRAFSTKRTEAKGAWRNTYSEIRCLDRYPTDSVVFGRNARSASSTTLDRKYPQLTGSVFFGPSRPPGATSVALPDNGIQSHHTHSHSVVSRRVAAYRRPCVYVCVRALTVFRIGPNVRTCVSPLIYSFVYDNWHLSLHIRQVGQFCEVSAAVG